MAQLWNQIWYIYMSQWEKENKFLDIFMTFSFNTYSLRVHYKFMHITGQFGPTYVQVKPICILHMYRYCHTQVACSVFRQYLQCQYGQTIVLTKYEQIHTLKLFWKYIFLSMTSLALCNKCLHFNYIRH